MSRRRRSKFESHRPNGFMQFYRQIYDSSAYRSLSFIERGALLHMLYHFIPERSEVIAMSNRRLAREIGVNKDTAGRALRRLEAVGLIRMIDESNWYLGSARSYRLTFMPYQGRQPSDDWAAFQDQGQVLPDKVPSIVGQLRRLSSQGGLTDRIDRTKST